MEKWLAAILIITGASAVEELDDSVMDRYSHYLEHPVNINTVSRSRLLSSGLVSGYQAATLADYKARCGDILSITELGTVDGFGEEYAKALEPFISLESNKNAGARHKDSLKFRTELTARFAMRRDYKTPAAGLKANTVAGDLLEAAWASRVTYTEPEPGFGTASVTLYGKRHLGKLVLGDWNARFGQGLVQWSGFTLSSYSTAASFCRNGTGLSPVRSYSRFGRGVAADFNFGRWMLSSGVSIDGIVIANAVVGLKNFSAGATVKYDGSVTRDRSASRLQASADWRIGFPGGAFYGEAAWTGKPDLLAGAFYVPSYGSRVALLSSWNRDKHMLALGYSRKGWLDVTAEGDWIGKYKGVRGKRPLQGRLNVRVGPSIRLGPGVLIPSVRVVESLSSEMFRSDFRFDADWDTEKWNSHIRAEAVRCESWAWLWYAEGGITGRLSAYLRGGMFFVNKWNDRIYVYERDAPGNFNVPAYYGRGWTASIYAKLKLKRHKFYIRLSEIRYFGKKKEPREELKFQYTFTF